jgi:hypothetical protein
MDLAIPLGNCLVTRKTLSSEKMVTKELNAQVQVCVYIIPQLAFHAANNIKCYFVFNKTKNLDIDNFGQLHVFRKLMVEDAR